MRALALDAAQVPRHFRVHLTLPGGERVGDQVVLMTDAEVPGFTDALRTEADKDDVTIEVFPA